ncbi:MAG: aminopeptidase N [Bdellovibrionales bacterium]|nr:aminopeptidase N [Bdellovibrionales bacterium]NQZ17871.1 aminopeptidase N [Bdellovibrionales bacterium]
MGETPQTVYLKDYQPPAYLIPQVDFTFELEEEQALVHAQLHLEKNPKAEATQELFFDGENLELKSIKMNGNELTDSDYSVSEKGLTLKKLEDNMVLETTVRIEPQNNQAFSGLYKTKTVFCTQMEAQGFRRTTFFMDRPDVLSKYTTTIIANKEKYPVLLSNGNFIDQKDLDNGKHQARWEDPFPKPCYLFALVAGDLDWIEDSYMTLSKRKVDLKIYVNKGKGERARYAMDSLKQSMKWDEDTYRLEYDLDIYNIVAVDDFNMGAMENKGLNIFNSKYVLADTQSATDDEFQGIQRVIGHEYFHNWSGNRVTCRDWFQLSLKEGLTVFRDQEFSSDMNARDVKRIEDVATLRSRQFPEDAGPMAHPVRPSSYIAIDNFYTVTVYEKGAEIIRMIQTLLGPDMFKKGVAKYFELFDGQAVTTDDWVHAMELVSKRDLTQFKTWYDQAGTPEISVHSNYDQENQQLTLELTQKTIDPISKEENKPYMIPIKIGLVSENGDALKFTDASGNQVSETVLELTGGTQKFVFNEIYQRPIISLNREFSAPIKVNFEQSEDDLYLLMTKDPDSFNRWESAQKIYLNTLLKIYNDYEQGQAPTFPESLTQAFEATLGRSMDNPAIAAKVLSLPSVQYLSQFISDVNPQNLKNYYEFFYNTLSDKLHSSLLELYTDLQSRKLTNSSKDLALRSLKNTVLRYLHRKDETAGAPVFYNQFSEASNMTDSIAALHRLSAADTPEFSKAMTEYYNCWKDDSLVINKWLAVSALSHQDSAFENIKKMAQDEVYDQTNPNKVFSLLYNFAQYNWSYFHTTTGETYDWLADQIIDIDSRNPQIASRVASSFNNWKKFAPEYQAGMEKALKKIHSSSPSDNLFEIVDRALKS